MIEDEEEDEDEDEDEKEEDGTMDLINEGSGGKMGAAIIEAEAGDPPTSTLLPRNYRHYSDS